MTMKGIVKYQNYKTLGKYKKKGVRNKRTTISRKIREAKEKEDRARQEKRQYLSEQA